MTLICAVTSRITHTVLHFGEAKLVRDANGCHELIGGNVSDLVTAKEWVSLFAHEMVFYHSKRTPKQKCSAMRQHDPARIKGATCRIF